MKKSQTSEMLAKAAEAEARAEAAATLFGSSSNKPGKAALVQNIAHNEEVSAA